MCGLLKVSGLDFPGIRPFGDVAMIFTGPARIIARFV